MLVARGHHGPKSQLQLRLLLPHRELQPPSPHALCGRPVPHQPEFAPGEPPAGQATSVGPGRAPRAAGSAEAPARAQLEAPCGEVLAILLSIAVKMGSEERQPAQPQPRREQQALPPPPLAAPGRAPPQRCHEEECSSSSAAVPHAEMRRTVQILSFGLENCENQLVDRCCNGAGGGFETFTDAELKRALDRLKWKVDVVYDARNFPDPDASGLTNHTGHNYKIISGGGPIDPLREWLHGLKRMFLRACDQHAGDGPLTLATYCRSGKHRSVGTALVLVHILREEGWYCWPPRHLSEKRWSRACCKGRCEDCA
ncbi:unnamed protein product [Prorocentrum cordatum]|uniref:RapZ C-terminal domain-containing protein n=1 Tax=Prorocentrum cordatum TaxID=2364126 RepID=A0ABN9Y3A2_9DINO|nr:unnamed protein product [Polarella glacialis]